MTKTYLSCIGLVPVTFILCMANRPSYIHSPANYRYVGLINLLTALTCLQLKSDCIQNLMNTISRSNDSMVWVRLQRLIKKNLNKIMDNLDAANLKISSTLIKKPFQDRTSNHLRNAKSGIEGIVDCNKQLLKGNVNKERSNNIDTVFNALEQRFRAQVQWPIHTYKNNVLGWADSYFNTFIKFNINR